ncbi:MAG: NAD-binding protein [Thermosynechococcus sp. Uc]|uniref:TrkA-related ion transporter n=1 Tax=Thermosynechococcus sp. Uc TaxID=3034853 RepID=UPI0019EFE3A9|nr:ion transporter [Thermosynechococcus sp. Uc]MDM7325598.1 NAD-binding protein [Thermosynechococcus sp. Uc]HIK25982.1 NAD-binding protein [Thermosynechococcus sp. M46_R2017_013]
MGRRRLQQQLDLFLHSPSVEIGLIVLILTWTTLVVVDFLTGQPPYPNLLIVLAEIPLRLCFTVELLLRFAIARKKQRFFRHYWLDLVAILPMPPQWPLFRLLPLLRLPRASVLINRTLHYVSPRIAVLYGAQISALLIIVLIMLFGGLAFYIIEGTSNPDIKTLGDALWYSFFSLVSAEPIGAYPQTHGGRIITLVVVLAGLTLFAVFTGVVSAFMVQRLQSAMSIKNFDLDELRNHIILCGWNRSAPLVLQELQTDPQTRYAPIVIVAELEQLPINELRAVDQNRLYFYSGDYTRIDVLEKVQIYHASRAILLADTSQPRSDQDRDARTVLAALTIEKLNPTIYTCAQLLDRNNNVQLQAAGVEDVVVADEMAGHLIGNAVRNQGAMDVFAELLTVQVGNQFYRLPLSSTLAGKTFWYAQQQFKEQYDALLVAVERRIEGRRQTYINPPMDYELQVGDYVVVIARQCPQWE